MDLKPRKLHFPGYNLLFDIIDIPGEAFFVQPAIHLSRNIMKCLQNVKNKKCIVGYFVSFFSHFASFFLILHFAPFRTIRSGILAKCRGIHSLFLCTHKIWMKYEQYIVGVSYFVVCFVKTLPKYLQNAKYNKCVAGLSIWVCWCLQHTTLGPSFRQSTTLRFVAYTHLSNLNLPTHRFTVDFVMTFCTPYITHILICISQPETFSGVKNQITLHCLPLGAVVSVAAIIIFLIASNF